MPNMSVAGRQRVRTRVLDACRRLIAEGVVPTGRALKLELPEHHPHTLIRYRDELNEAGAIALSDLWPGWTDDVAVGLGFAAYDAWRWTVSDPSAEV